MILICFALRWNVPTWELIETPMASFSGGELVTFIRLLEKLRAPALSQLGLDGDGMEGKANSN